MANTINNIPNGMMGNTMNGISNGMIGFNINSIPSGMMGNTMNGISNGMIGSNINSIPSGMMGNTINGISNGMIGSNINSIPSGMMGNTINNGPNGIITNYNNGFTLIPQINPIENNDDEEIIKNIEKTAIKKYTSQDTTFSFTNEGLFVIVNNSITNKNYIKNSFKCIFLNYPYKKITEHIFWFQGLQYISIPPSMEKIIEYAYHISQEFIFLTFKREDFISLNTGQVLLTNLDNILRKIKVDGVTLDFFSPLNLPLLQNLQVSLNTDEELFLDSQNTYKKNELSCLKNIQEKIEIVKRGKNNG